MVKTTDKIISFIYEMPEEEAKRKLAELMLNYNSIGIGGYTETECMKDYKSMFIKISLNDLWKH